MASAAVSNVVSFQPVVEHDQKRIRGIIGRSNEASEKTVSACRGGGTVVEDVVQIVHVQRRFLLAASGRQTREWHRRAGLAEDCCSNGAATVSVRSLGTVLTICVASLQCHSNRCWTGLVPCTGRGMYSSETALCGVQTLDDKTGLVGAATFPSPGSLTCCNWAFRLAIGENLRCETIRIGNPTGNRKLVI